MNKLENKNIYNKGQQTHLKIIYQKINNFGIMVHYNGEDQKKIHSKGVIFKNNLNMSLHYKKKINLY